MNECRMCGEQTENESLLCDGCRGDLTAGDETSQRKFIDDILPDAGLKPGDIVFATLDPDDEMWHLRLRDSSRAGQILADLKKRCPTCGRMDHCCCGPDCEYCTDGKPKASAMKWSRLP
jgi:hypothetical protein